MNILEEAFEGKPITETSKKLYLANLKRLNGGEVPRNFKFLCNLEEIQEKISRYKPNTQRSYIISVVSLLKILKEKQPKKYKQLYDDYYAVLENLNVDLRDNTTKTEKEEEEWIGQDAVKAKLEEHMAILETVKDLKRINENQYDDLLDLVILGLFILQKPRRNKDYQEMFIIKKYKEEFGTDKNFLDLFSNNFIFNNYKTRGTYLTQSQPIDEVLRQIIDVYMKFHPLKQQFKQANNITTPFLVKFDGEPLLSNNSLTRKLYKIFDRKIGSSMLRKLYLTEKYGDKMKQVNEIMEEMKDDATAMGNSVGTIQTNYIKKDTPVDI
jgi:virulence-associated protein VapD